MILNMKALTRYLTSKIRRTLFVVVFLTSLQLASGQRIPTKIEKAESEADVEMLIRSLGEGYKNFTIKPINQFQGSHGGINFCKRMSDSLHITRSFYKADFDKNGYPDLLVIGENYGFEIVIVMSYGNDSLNPYRLTRKSFQECTFPKILENTIIRYYYMSIPGRMEKNRKASLQFANLVFKYGDFIEYNPLPKKYSIERIDFKTTICFGTCPVFNISINGDKSSSFEAQEFNKQTDTSAEITGTFKSTLEDSSFNEIINLLEYIDFPSLKDEYSVSWTDDQTSTLTVTYNNGKIKTITDYGMIGTFGLDRLYQLLFALRFNQHWK